MFLLCQTPVPLQVVSKELVCKSCLTRTLNKLETMMTILQGETTQGTVTPTGIADNILNITGELCPVGGDGGLAQGQEEAEGSFQAPSSAIWALAQIFRKLCLPFGVWHPSPLFSLRFSQGCPGFGSCLCGHLNLTVVNITHYYS